MVTSHIRGRGLSFFLLLVTAFAFVIPSAFSDLDDGLISWWGLYHDDVEDVSSNGKDLTADGSVAIFNGVSQGFSYWFDGGDDDLTRADDALFDSLDAISACFWINPASIANDDFLMQDDRYSIKFDTDGVACGSADNLAFLEEGKATNCFTTAVFNTSEWTHVCFTRSAGGSANISQYVNGDFVESVTGSATAPQAAANDAFHWGTNTPQANFYHGYMDMLGLWNYPLNGTAVSKLYNGGYGCNPVAFPKGCAGNVTDPLIDGKLLSYMTFDDTLIDFIWFGNASVIAVTGDPSFDSGTAKINSSLALDGNDGVTLDTTAVSPFDDDSHQVVNIWVYESTAPDDNDCIWRERTAQEGIMSLRYDTTNGWECDFWDGNYDTASIGELDAGWNMITCVWNQSVIAAYLNGTYVARTASAPKGNPTGDEEFNLGMCEGPSGYFTGYLDELSMFNHSITDAQLLELYNDGDGLQYPFSPAAGGAPPAGGGNDWDPTYDWANTFDVVSDVTDYSGGNYTVNPFLIYVNVTTDYNDSVHDAVAYWPFEGNLLDYYLNYNLTNGTSPTYKSGPRGQYAEFVSQSFNSTNKAHLNWSDNNISISAWVKVNHSASHSTIISYADDLSADNDGGWVFYVDSSERLRFFADDAALPAKSDDGYTGTQTWSDGWHHVVVLYDPGTSIDFYIDGTAVSDTSSMGTTSGYHRDGNLSVGSLAGTNFFNGSLDEIKLYNRTLTLSEIHALNRSVDVSGDCNLTFFDGGQTMLTNTVYSLNLTSSTTHTVNVSTLNYENVSWTNVSCSDGWKTDYLNSSTFVDTVVPLSIENSFTNGTILYKNYTDTLNIDTNGSDTWLYATNFTLKYPNGSVIVTNLTEDIQNFSHNWNYTIDLSSDSQYPTGNYTYEVWVWDAHTDNVVREMNWTYFDNTLLADNNIMFTGDIKFTGILGIPLTYFYIAEDRYKLKVTFNEDKLVHELNLSDFGSDLKFQKQTDYLGHFVHFPTKRWIDFEGDNVRDVHITDNGDGSFRLLITLFEESDEIQFESIGSLNELFEVYTFSLEQPMVINVLDQVLYDQGINSSITTFTAKLYGQDNSLVNTISTTDGSAELPYQNGTFNVTVSAVNYNPTTQLVNMSQNNLTTMFLNSSILTYIQFFDCDNNPVQATGEIFDVDQGYNFTSQYRISIASTNLSTGPVRVFFNPEASSENYTQFFEFYNDGSYSDNVNLSYICDNEQIIYYQVRDVSGDFLENAYIKLYDQYPGNSSISPNSWRLIGQRLADYNGYTHFWVDPDAAIKWVVSKDNFRTFSDHSLTEDLSHSTQATAKQIVLTPLVGLNPNVMIWAYIDRFDENTTKMRNYFSMDRDASIYYNTSYNQGLQKATGYQFGSWYFDLTRDLDYVGANFTVQVYDLNNTVYTLQATGDVTYWTWDTEIGGMFSISGQAGYQLLFVALIMISILFGTLVQSATFGATAFRAGTIILAWVNPAFINLAVLNLLYMVLRMVYRSISE